MDNDNVVNILFGPPKEKADCHKMLSLFFENKGKHITCGGSSGLIAAQFLGVEVIASLQYEDNDIPPIVFIEGIDLATEGIITMKRVLEYIEDYNKRKLLVDKWHKQRDGASLLTQVIVEATTINFFIGQALNPAHQLSSSQINFDIKMNTIKGMLLYLNKMGKNVSVQYF